MRERVSDDDRPNDRLDGQPRRPGERKRSTAALRLQASLGGIVDLPHNLRNN